MWTQTLLKGMNKPWEGSEEKDAWFTDGNDGLRVHKIKANTHSSWGLWLEATQLPPPSSASTRSTLDCGLSPCYHREGKMRTSAATAAGQTHVWASCNGSRSTWKHLTQVRISDAKNPGTSSICFPSSRLGGHVGKSCSLQTVDGETLQPP